MTHLFRDLAKVIDEADSRILLQWIINTVNVYIPFIEQMVKHIDGIHGRLALLFATKYEIYPLVEVGTHVVGLQRLCKT